MSEADQQRVEKEVTVVAYSLDEYSEIRLKSWAEKITGVDLTSYETVIEEDFKVEFGPGDGRGYERSLNAFSHRKEQVEDAKEELEEAGIENVRINKDTRTQKKFENSINSARKDFRFFLFSLLPDKLEGGITRHDHGTRWNDEQDHWGVRLKSLSFDEMRVLSKEQKRQNDDLFETMAERPCLSFSIKMESPDYEHIDFWTDQVVPECVKLLSKHPHIGKVRFMDCVTTTEQEGECYSL